MLHTYLVSIKLVAEWLFNYIAFFKGYLVAVVALQLRCIF